MWAVARPKAVDPMPLRRYLSRHRDLLRSFKYRVFELRATSRRARGQLGAMEGMFRSRTYRPLSLLGTVEQGREVCAIAWRPNHEKWL